MDCYRTQFGFNEDSMGNLRTARTQFGFDDGIRGNRRTTRTQFGFDRSTMGSLGTTRTQFGFHLCWFSSLCRLNRYSKRDTTVLRNLRGSPDPARGHMCRLISR